MNARLIAVGVLLIAAFVTPSRAADSATEPRFVGSPTWAACHATEYAAWQGSQHRVAMQVADESFNRDRGNELEARRDMERLRAVAAGW